MTYLISRNGLIIKRVNTRRSALTYLETARIAAIASGLAVSFTGKNESMKLLTSNGNTFEMRAA